MPWLHRIFEGIFFFLKSIIHLLYPDVCLHCHRELTIKTPFLCYGCLSKMVLVKWRKKEAHHLLEQAILGSKIIESCVLFNFERDSPVQTVIHQIKYKFNRSAAVYFGTLLGQQYFALHSKAEFDVLIPVPVHHNKRYDRGYNQSELIALGISSVIGVPVGNNLLKKTKNTKSQTKLSKEERKENTKGTFSVSDKIIEHSTVAIVDDVITTGATLNSICEILVKKNENLQITIFSLAIANT